MKRETWRAALGALAAVGLIAGCSAAAPTATPPPAPAAAGAAGAPAAGGPGGPGGTARFGGLTGTVARIDGGTLVVETSNGETDVALGDQTTVRKLTKAARGDLQAGQAVTGRGDVDAQGKVQVRTLQILPAGATGRQGGFGGGARAAGNGTPRVAANGTPRAASGTPGATANGTPAATANGTPAARGNGAGGNGGPPAGFVGGTVAGVAGDQLTLTTPNNGSVTVTVPDTAQIEMVTNATKADLQPGETVSVATPGQGGPAAVVTITAG